MICSVEFKKTRLLTRRLVKLKICFLILACTLLPNRFLLQANAQTRLTLGDGYVYVVVASRRKPEAAVHFAKDYARNIAPVMIVQTRNGQFAIVGGILTTDKSIANLEMFIALRLLPPDAFLSKGEAFLRVLWPKEDAIPVKNLIASNQVQHTVSRIQVALSRLGYYSGDVDGLIGSQTRRALKAFELDNGSLGMSIHNWRNGRVLAVLERSSNPAHLKRVELEKAQADGFSTVEQAKLARAGGFYTADEYESALEGGFFSAEIFRNAKLGGFKSKERYTAARALGFSTFKEMQQAEHAGFKQAERYRNAKKSGFLSNDDWQRAQKLGINTFSELVMFERSGFEQMEAFRLAKKQGHRSKTSALNAIEKNTELALQAAQTLMEETRLFVKSNSEIPSILMLAEQVAKLKKLANEAIPSALDGTQILFSELPSTTDTLIDPDGEEQSDNLSEILFGAEGAKKKTIEGETTAYGLALRRITSLKGQTDILEKALNKEPSFRRFRAKRKAEESKIQGRALERENTLLKPIIEQAKSWIANNILHKNSGKIIGLLKQAIVAENAQDLVKMKSARIALQSVSELNSK